MRTSKNAHKRSVLAFRILNQLISEANPLHVFIIDKISSSAAMPAVGIFKVAPQTVVPNVKFPLRQRSVSCSTARSDRHSTRIMMLAANRRYHHLNFQFFWIEYHKTSLNASNRCFFRTMIVRGKDGARCMPARPDRCHLPGSNLHNQTFSSRQLSVLGLPAAHLYQTDTRLVSIITDIASTCDKRL